MNFGNIEQIKNGIENVSLEVVNKVVTIELNKIIENEDNFYDTSNVSDLVESIKTQGQLMPLIITEDKLLLSGHRRLKALRILGFDSVSCIILSDLTAWEKISVLIESNNQRIKSKEEINKEIIKRKDILIKLKESNPEKFKNININKQIALDLGVSESKIAKTIKKTKEQNLLTTDEIAKTISKTPKSKKNKQETSMNDGLKNLFKNFIDNSYKESAALRKMLIKYMYDLGDEIIIDIIENYHLVDYVHIKNLDHSFSKAELHREEIEVLNIIFMTYKEK
jgi:ParB-like chromosome segregation protein Spo0J